MKLERRAKQGKTRIWYRWYADGKLVAGYKWGLFCSREKTRPSDTTEEQVRRFLQDPDALTPLCIAELDKCLERLNNLLEGE